VLRQMCTMSWITARASLSFEQPELRRLPPPQMQPAAVRLPLLQVHCRQPHAGSLAICTCSKESDDMHSTQRCDIKLLCNIKTTAREKP
jgi:hypothetical protein